VAAAAGAVQTICLFYVFDGAVTVTAYWAIGWIFTAVISPWLLPAGIGCFYSGRPAEQATGGDTAQPCAPGPLVLRGGEPSKIDARRPGSGDISAARTGRSRCMRTCGWISSRYSEWSINPLLTGESVRWKKAWIRAG